MGADDDDDDDDMFQFDTLSHRSSLTSLSLSKIGSLENIGNRGHIPTAARVVENEWENKLLGHKKGLYDTNMYDDTMNDTSTYNDTVSMSSIISAASHSTIQDT